MNYLDIAKIVQVIDDYFLLFDSESATSVKSKQKNPGCIDGLIIERNLRNGHIKVVIDSGFHEDVSITISYHKKGSKNEHDGCHSIDSEEFSPQSISNAVRKMVIYDSEVQKPKLNDLVLSPNSR